MRVCAIVLAVYVSAYLNVLIYIYILHVYVLACVCVCEWRMYIWLSIYVFGPVDMHHKDID